MPAYGAAERPRSPPSERMIAEMRDPAPQTSDKARAHSGAKAGTDAWNTPCVS